ncbi:MAG: exodeoxyribonuclease [Patescibacteria group bacterium]|jgi:DNA polymerase III epsilon subunit-like protein|nr:exodeoxyribonuclease [Patescibacteria group bacterium]
MIEKTLIFLDTETTGNMPDDKLCQLCYKVGDKIIDELYKPDKPISIESMAVHHITEKMVAGKPAFKESPEFSELQNLIDAGGIVIAHNAKFDVGMLEKEGIKVGKTIDTFRLARHMDPDGKIPSYRLQYLRYLLGIEVEATAHDAKGDVLVLEKLFERLLKKVMEKENISKETAIDQMVDISSRPVIFKFFNFGKYKNESLEDVTKKDRGYLEWLLAQKKQNNAEEEEDWIYTIEHFLSL